MNDYRVNAGEWWRFGIQTVAKCGDTFWLALDLDGYPIGVVADESDKSLFLCEPIYEWTKTHSLHNAANLVPHPLHFILFWFKLTGHNAPWQENSINHGFVARFR